MKINISKLKSFKDNMSQVIGNTQLIFYSVF